MKISFVIPTFNFGAFIAATLDSILVERQIEYEVVVYDGCSTDDTAVIMEDYCSKDSRIKYIRAAMRSNIDIDLNDALPHATGDYIWTLSADDLLVPNWGVEMARLVSTRESDIFLFPAIHCTLNMQPYRAYQILRTASEHDSTWSLKSDGDVAHYLAAMRTSEGLFSFCSACLVRRDRILNVDPMEGANGTCWRYAARLICVAVNYPASITIAGSFLVRKRGENDSFGSMGVVRRIGIAICQWSLAIELLNVPDPLKLQMKKLVHSDISFLSLLYASQSVNNQADRKLYEECVRQRFAGGELSMRFKHFVLLHTRRVGGAPTLRIAKKFVQRVRQLMQQSRLDRTRT